MAESSERDPNLAWFREPPNAGEIRLLVECGDGAELSPDAQRALDALIAELHEAEVSGYTMGRIGPTIGIFGATVNLQSGCLKQTCSGHDCSQHDCGEYRSKFI